MFCAQKHFYCAQKSFPPEIYISYVPKSIYMIAKIFI
jgi:hypothetical protein